MSLPVEFALRLLLAGALGTIIGLDREYRAKEAGYRTHFLVSLGSALMMIVSQYGFMEVLRASDGLNVRLDPSRIAAQVVTGIGFIGAGTIIFQKQIVRGLTTAAGIWATSGIGLAVGAGMYTLGISATVLTLVGLEVLSYCFKSLGMRSLLIEFSTTQRETLSLLAAKFNSKDYNVVSYQLDERTLGEVTTYHVTMVIKSRKRNADESILLSLLQDYKDITVHRME
jgi:putative Mg2+ transporter-C (MgtC) family protein